MNLFAKPSLGADPAAVANDEHADHQFGINRGPANRAIERPQLLSNIAQIKKPIDATQQMIVGNVILKAKVVKQSLWRRLRPHHHSALLANHKENGITPATDEQARLNQQNRPKADFRLCWMYDRASL